MDHYKLKVYKSESQNSYSGQCCMTWIVLLDTAKGKSHIFSFIPGDHCGMFGSCGIFRKKNSVPDNLEAAADISLTETAYIEMVKEGYCLHNRFLIYDDCTDIPSTQYN